MTAILGVEQTSPRTVAPPGSCDCHTHVFGPAATYPFSPNRTYTPGDAAVGDLRALHAMLGLERVVIVHPSPYGTDNSCSVDAIQTLGDRARGVAVLDEATPFESLRALHDGGMRGARVNLETYGTVDPAEAWRKLQATAELVAPLGWHVQIYAGIAVIEAIGDRLLDLPTPLVIDHFGRLSAARGVGQPGLDRLKRLLESGRVYLKLSGAHRISDVPGYADVAPLARALIAANPDRLVWGTDWPHPGARTGGVRTLDMIEPFHPQDDGAALDRLGNWAGDDETLRRILVDNPVRLYDFPPIGSATSK